MKLINNILFFIEMSLYLIITLNRYIGYYYITYIFDNNNYSNNFIAYYLISIYINEFLKNIISYTREYNLQLVKKKNDEIIYNVYGRIISIPIFIIEIICLISYLCYIQLYNIAIAILFYIGLNIYQVLSNIEKNKNHIIIKPILLIIINYLLILQQNGSLFYWLTLSIDSITNNISIYDDQIFLDYYYSNYNIVKFLHSLL